MSFSCKIVLSPIPSQDYPNDAISPDFSQFPLGPHKVLESCLLSHISIFTFSSDEEISVCYFKTNVPVLVQSIKIEMFSLVFLIYL